MSKAFLDTTIVADRLLKPGSTGPIAKAALSKFDGAEAPEYALKELHLGALRGFVYAHNVLKTEGTVSAAMAKIRRLNLQRNLASTAYEAVEEGIRRSKGVMSTRTQAEYDVAAADMYRMALKALILRAWKRRRRIAEIVFPLPCYRQEGPTEDYRGELRRGRACDDAPGDCALAGFLRTRIDDVIKVRNAILRLGSDRREDQNRTRTLKEFLKRPDRPIDEKSCRYLGDAVFAILCPASSVILTTNTRDHKPLAAALGKEARSPSEVLAPST